MKKILSLLLVLLMFSLTACAEVPDTSADAESTAATDDGWYEIPYIAPIPDDIESALTQPLQTQPTASTAS